MDAGRIVQGGSPQAVFDGGSPLLPALGLDLPFAVEAAHRLRNEGLPLPASILSVEQLARALC
jgi:hypothetical protein